MKPILRSALDGHNVCVFAYGQTGTGKTYTMVSVEQANHSTISLSVRKYSYTNRRPCSMELGFEIFALNICCESIIFYLQDGTSDQPGIVPRALEELFSQSSLNELSSQTFSMSMLEVYMGSIRDLLAPKTTYKPHEASTRWYSNLSYS